MSKLIRRFILRIIVLTLILAGVCAAVYILLIPEFYFETLPFLLIIFPVVSSFIHDRLLKASQKSLSKFNIAFMLSFMLKLIVYVALAATVISFDAENQKAAVITVLLFYLVYTIFDIRQVLNDLKVLNSDIND